MSKARRTLEEVVSSIRLNDIGNGCKELIYPLDPRIKMGKTRYRVCEILYHYTHPEVALGTKVYRTCRNKSCMNVEHMRVDTLHGLKDPRLECIWENMISRCYNPHRPEYPNYGARGIRVCDEWRTFKPFQEWALSHGYKKDLEIDRIDNNGDYTPDNCRWVTHSMNNLNHRKRSDNTIGYTAIERAGRKFYFRLTINGVKYHGKMHLTPEAAYAEKMQFIKDNNLYYYNE